MVEIAKVPLACCRFELEKQGLVPPSDKALADILETDEAFVIQLNQYYVGEESTGDHGLDTYERDWLKENIAMHFTGRSWPCNSDDRQSTEQFAKDLVVNTKAAGWLRVRPK
jgi:hypothetical protein